MSPEVRELVESIHSAGCYVSFRNDLAHECLRIRVTRPFANSNLGHHAEATLDNTFAMTLDDPEPTVAEILRSLYLVVATQGPVS